MGPPGPVGLRRHLLERFRWTDGHADFAAFLADGSALAAVGPGLAEPFASSTVDAVVGLEARGFVLGGLVAAELGCGLVLARKAGAVHPGPKTTVVSSPDWRGRRVTIEMSAVVGRGDRVLLVDDWIQTGAQASAVHRAVAGLGAGLVGVAVLVDDTSAEVRRRLRVRAVVRSSELGPSSPTGDGRRP